MDTPIVSRAEEQAPRNSDAIVITNFPLIAGFIAVMPEAIPFLLRRPKALALLVLAVCLSLSMLVIWQLEQNQRHATRADVENIAQNHAFFGA